MLKKILLFVVMLWALPGVAQIFVQNTMYPSTRFIYNPAVAGAREGTEATLLGRLQWVGIDGAPRLFTASIQSSLTKLQSGVGAYIIGDELGPLTTLGVNVAYSYHMDLRPGDISSPRISIGVFGGLLQKTLNGDFRYDQSDGIDPVVPQGSLSTVVPNLGAGVYFSLPDVEGNERLFLGLSGQDLLEPTIEDLTFTQGVGDDSRVRRSFYMMGGYTFDINEDISLQPTFLARTDGTSYQFDLSAYVSLKKIVVLGVSHRFYNDSFSGIAGFNVTPDLFVGYAYDYTLSRLNANGDLASHELVLTYRFKTATKNPDRIDNTIKGGLRR